MNGVKPIETSEGTMVYEKNGLLHGYQEREVPATEAEYVICPDCEEKLTLEREMPMSYPMFACYSCERTFYTFFFELIDIENGLHKVDLNDKKEYKTSVAHSMINLASMRNRFVENRESTHFDDVEIQHSLGMLDLDLFIYARGREAIGIIGSREIEKKVKIKHLFVIPKFRDKGLGKAMTEFWAEKQDKPISVDCHEGSKGFYKKIDVEFENI